MKKLLSILFAGLTTGAVVAQLPTPDTIITNNAKLAIQPVQHASFVLNYKSKNIYVDPSGGANLFKGLADPDIVLITDIHGDHFDINTLKALKTSKTVIIAPKAVADKLPADLYKTELIVLNNGDKVSVGDIDVEAIPMYNLPEAADAFHTKGRGNGYILTIGGKRLYISGDTEDIPEMRSLQNIDIAFVCMNLPYTMDVDQASSGVIAFAPAIVYPYHYRGQDTEKFKEKVDAAGKNIQVWLRNWYAQKQ